MTQLAEHEVSDLLSVKQQEIQLLKAKQELIRNYGLKYYQPHAKQDAFHRAGRFKRRAVFAGNRFGKSDCGAAEDASQALGHRPWMAESDPCRTEGIPQRPQKILVITTDWGKVDEIFTNERGSDLGKLWKFLPRGCVKSKKRNHGSGAIETIELENGSLIQFDTVESFKKNPQSAESSHWDVIHVDEPCPEKMFSAHARGLMDRDGQAYFTLTPLREPWIYDIFFGDSDARSIVERGGANLRGEDYWSVTGTIWDNPYLSEESIFRYLNELSDPEERECRERGIPLQFAGLIYKEFESSVHIMRNLPTGWEDFNRPPTVWPVYLQVDPHPQTPTAALLTTVGPDGRRYTFEEVWHKGVAETIIADIMEKVGKRSLINPQCDPLAFNEDKISGTCWADDFGLNGIWFSRAPKDLQRGIMATKSVLRSRFVDGSPAWMFSPHLKRFLWEIKRWSWNKDNRPVDKDDHTLECLYRTVLSDPSYIEQTSSDDSLITQDLPIVSGLETSERWASREYGLN